MNTHTKIVIGALGGMALVMSGLTVLLVHEYQQLHGKVSRLIQLKKEYKTYVRAYKSVDASSVQTEQTDNSDEDEGAEDDQVDDQVAEYEGEPCATFILLCRDSDYLKEEALSLAKEYCIEEPVKKLYENEAHEPPLFASLLKPKKKIVRAAVQPRKRSVYVPPKELHNTNFACPLERSKFWISSLYGTRKRKNGTWQFHHGIDMAAFKGTPVFAAADGIVHDAIKSDKGYGNCIVLKHDSKFKTRYAHLHTIHVTQGQRVKKGQKIGTVGSTGLVRGKHGKERASHLHFEVMVYDKRVNPILIVR